MATQNKYSQEVRERAVRLVRESVVDHPSDWGAIQSVASKIRCTTETLRNRVRRSEVDAGGRAGISTWDRERMKALERDVRERKRANENRHKASA